MTMIYLGIGITEAKILHILRHRDVWQPSIMLFALLVGAFAPPIISVLAAVCKNSNQNNKYYYTEVCKNSFNDSASGLAS